MKQFPLPSLTQDQYSTYYGKVIPREDKVEEKIVYPGIKLTCPAKYRNLKKVINDVKADLEKNMPMDRLIFGDVGYGKTEVALRAAIKVAFSGGQVALLAPTTILVQQHIETFLERLNNYPLNIKHLSRFVRKKEINEDLLKTKIIDFYSVASPVVKVRRVSFHMTIIWTKSVIVLSSALNSTMSKTVTELRTLIGSPGKLLS